MPYSLQVSPTEPFYEKKLEYDHKFLVDKKKKTKKPGIGEIFCGKNVLLQVHLLAAFVQ